MKVIIKNHKIAVLIPTSFGGNVRLDKTLEEWFHEVKPRREFCRLFTTDMWGKEEGESILLEEKDIFEEEDITVKSQVNYLSGYGGTNPGSDWREDNSGGRTTAVEGFPEFQVQHGWEDAYCTGPRARDTDTYGVRAAVIRHNGRVVKRLQLYGDGEKTYAVYEDYSGDVYVIRK